MLKSFQHYIDGEFSDAAQTFDSINPATGAVWATMPAASTADVDRAVRAADRALFAPEWAGLNASQRGRPTINRFAREDHRQPKALSLPAESPSFAHS